MKPAASKNKKGVEHMELKLLDVSQEIEGASRLLSALRMSVTDCETSAPTPETIGKALYSLEGYLDRIAAEIRECSSGTPEST